MILAGIYSSVPALRSFYHCWASTQTLIVGKLNDSLNPIHVGVHVVISMISIHSSDSSHLLLEIKLRTGPVLCFSTAALFIFIPRIPAGSPGLLSGTEPLRLIRTYPVTLNESRTFFLHIFPVTSLQKPIAKITISNQHMNKITSFLWG